MQTRLFRLLITCFCLLAAAVGSSAQCTLTGNLDTDFVGKPGVIIRDSATLPPPPAGSGPYALSDPPLAQFLPGGTTRLIQDGAVVPSGFHISRVGINYSCAPDILCVGLDVSNQSSLVGAPGPTSRAWDADADGNACTVTNPFLQTAGDLDPLLPGNDDLPGGGLSEKYIIFLDVDQNGTTDVILTAYDDGTVAGSDATAVDFPGPCPGSIIHVTLKNAVGQNLLAAPFNLSVNMVYGQDIEFAITGLQKLTPTAPNQICDVNLRAFADSDLDASPEASLNFGVFDFLQQANVTISCNKTANGVPLLVLGDLPAAVTYQITATNTGNVPVDIRIVDATLGIDQTFQNVAPAGAVNAGTVVNYGSEYCGHADVVNAATVTATATDCCLTGDTTDQCQATATVRFPPGLTASYECEKTVNGVNQLNLTASDVPIELVYVLKATNTGQVNLDITIEDLGVLPPGTVCDTPLPAVFTDVPPGGVRQVTCRVTVQECPGNVVWENTERVTAVLSDDTQDCVGPLDPEKTCSTTVTWSCDRELVQSFPGNSGGTNQHQSGYLGQFGDTISSVPGILSIVPGVKWCNFVRACQDGVPYVIKNVVLRKQTPDFIQCADIFPAKIVSQQGTAGIRLWWPLMYEAPGTTWTLTIIYGTSTPYDDDGPGPHPPGYVHTEVWTWTLDATLKSMKDVLELFHEIPFGLDEVPVISDEVLYPILQAKLDETIRLVSIGQLGQAGLLLGDFEMEVADACIAFSPQFPNPTGPGTGIANSLENPACCKLMIDAEYVGFALGLFNQNK